MNEVDKNKTNTITSITTSIMAVNGKTGLLVTRLKYAINKFAHTWSPIASVFNELPSNKIISILKERKGLFDVPELTSDKGFYALCNQCDLKTGNFIREAISTNRVGKMVEIFDELSDTLCKVADLAQFIRIVHPDPKYTQSADIACSSVSNIVEKLNTNYELYAALKQVVNHNDPTETSEVDRHVSHLFLFDFEQSGIHLPENERGEVVDLNNIILHLGQQFVSGSSYPRLVLKNEISEDIRRLRKVEEQEPIMMTGFHSESSDAAMRQFAYRLFLLPDSHQEYLLSNLLECRDNLAKLCGFRTYSERELKGSLAESPATVLNFLNLLSDALKPRAEEDFQLMLEMKRSKDASKQVTLNAWDVPFYSHTIRKNVFKISAEEYAPYFSLGTCMDGFNKLMQSLFGITLENTELAIGEAWDPNIYKLAVTHEFEGLLGYVYCDFYAREGKQTQDCHFTIQGGRDKSDGTYQLPVVAITLNFPEPKWSCPSLLNPHMVDNLFHELGHAMHSMLARTKFQHITGTRCSTDFVEVPSVLMEYFSSDVRVLSTFARHFQTGEPMPENMLHRLCASKNLFAASDMQLQVFYSALDQYYHGQHPLKGTTTSILEEIQNKYYSIPYVPNTAWQLRFSHLVGYGAKYYAYLMSKAVASWIWQMYFKQDPFSRKHGDLYRYQCLHFGGGKPAKKLVSDFLKREVTPEALVDSLVKDTDEKMQEVKLFHERD